MWLKGHPAALWEGEGKVLAAARYQADAASNREESHRVRTETQPYVHLEAPCCAMGVPDPKDQEGYIRHHDRNEFNTEPENALPRNQDTEGKRYEGRQSLDRGPCALAKDRIAFNVIYMD